MTVKMKVVYFAATLFVLSIVCDASDEPKCKEGETMEKDCNTCSCSDTGVMVCTQRACIDAQPLPDTPPIGEEHTEIPETNGQVCTPNETKMQDCNRCKCSANGIVWICTRRFCPSTPSPKIAVNEPGFTCIPNQVFKDDCNTCSCDESGTLARCTAMACDPSERQKRSYTDLITTTELPVLKANDCVPGTRWKQECNWCWCSDNGFAACTLKGCLGPNHKFHRFHPVLGTTVVPETTTVLESSAAGEKKAVNSNRVKRENLKKSKKEKNNQEGDSQLIETPTQDPVPSSTGRLNDYGSISGLVYTESDLLSPDFTCKPSESFKVECNTCWCGASGKKVRYCTRQACHPKTYPTLAPAQ